jgi:outer membrane protein, multidrug efflux system
MIGFVQSFRQARCLAAFLSALSAVTFGGCAVVPRPLDASERAARAGSDWEQMFRNQEPIHSSLDVHQVVSRALKYNLANRQKRFELSLADAHLKARHADMLPNIVANAGYRVRSNDPFYNTKSQLTQQRSSDYAVGEDRQVFNADLTMVWNLLDFGVTYLRAQQEADLVLIAEEKRIKAAQNLVVETQETFWRAVAAERLLPRLDQCIIDMRQALSGWSAVATKAGTAAVSDSARAKTSLAPEHVAAELKQQRAQIASLRVLLEVRHKLAQARAELTTLMNLPPGTQLTLSAPTLQQLDVPRVHVDVDTFVQYALINRPELREEDYQKRLRQTEVRVAWVRLLPGVELKGGQNFDSNSYLLNPAWSNAAAMLTSNLVKLATAPIAIRNAEADVAVADARRLAATAAVVAQVHIALENYGAASEMLRLARLTRDVEGKLAKIAARHSNTPTTMPPTAMTEARVSELNSDLQFYQSHAEALNAYGRIMNSIGMTYVPVELEKMSVDELAAALRRSSHETNPLHLVSR